VRIVPIGLALFGIGIVFIAVDFIAYFTGDHNSPLWLNLACLSAPIGFALAIGGSLSQGRADQRRALRELDA
jgi:hypothetical protein